MGTDFGVNPIFFSRHFKLLRSLPLFLCHLLPAHLEPELSDQVIQHCASANSRAAPDLFPTQMELAGQDWWEKSGFK